MAEVEKNSKETSQTPKPEEKKSSHKGCCIGCSIAFFLFLSGLGVVLFLGWRMLSEQLATLQLPTSPTIEVTAGTAEKKSGIKWIPIISGESVGDGDVIKTGKDTDATVTFPNGSQLRLDQLTEISIQPTSLGVSLVQTSGRTWSRVTKLLGSKVAYEIETPTAVATVRGTAFSTTVTPEDTLIETDQDTVEVAAMERFGSKRSVLARLSVEEGYSTKIAKKDLAGLREGKIKLTKDKIKDELRSSPWFKKNRERDKRIVASLSKKSISPFQIFKIAKTVSRDDLATLQSFVKKLESGTIEPTALQTKELDIIGQRLAGATVIDESLAADAARALAILDPENFADTVHWTQVLTKVLPYYKMFQNASGE